MQPATLSQPNDGRSHRQVGVRAQSDSHAQLGILDMTMQLRILQ
jgi:hypothetical protein